MMSLKIEQSAKYRGDDWWEWAVWVGGAPDELERVDYVRYTLHSTFPNPVRTIRDRATQFRLETAGWGVFRIYALVVFKDGEHLNLRHDLELLYDDGTPTSA